MTDTRFLFTLNDFNEVLREAHGKYFMQEYQEKLKENQEKAHYFKSIDLIEQGYLRDIIFESNIIEYIITDLIEKGYIKKACIKKALIDDYDITLNKINEDIGENILNYFND